MPPKGTLRGHTDNVTLGRPSRVSKTSYRLTCSGCRARKVKCDGATPACRICLAYGKPCNYDKTPPMTQVIAMAKHIEDLEQALNASANEQSDDQAAQPRKETRTYLPEYERSGQLDGQQSTPTFQSTSAVQEPARIGEMEELPGPALSARHVDASPTIMSADQLELWQSRAYEFCAMQLHLSAEKVTHLFSTYWTWVFPAFMFVSRPQFLMSLATGGPYCSPLLSSVLCLQATRFTDHALKEDLLAHVHFLLGQEIHRAPSIPLVQALLQLSAREIGNGSLSQGWLYSGMAFRLAVDMGIMVKPTNASVDATDAAVRGQLAWSCYLWDKSVSLYLGRVPSLPECPDFEPSILDDQVERGAWEPYPRSIHRSSSWSQEQSYGATCFANFCKIMKIVNDVLNTMYAKKSGSDVQAFVCETREKLEDWRRETPPQLIVAPGSQKCPASHILSQNLLYYTTTILLHRPFRNDTHCRSICRQASVEVEHLLLLLETTLGLTHVTYLMAYCAYTAATVAMLDLHDGIAGSQQRVNTFLRALYGVLKSCPGIQRSIDIVIKAFDYCKSTKPNTSGTSSAQPSSSVTEGRLTERDPLPAFPIDEYNEFDNWNGFNQNTLPFGTLDPYAIDWNTLPNGVIN